MSRKKFEAAATFYVLNDPWGGKRKKQMAAVGRVTARAAPPNHGGNVEVCVWLAGWLSHQDHT